MKEKIHISWKTEAGSRKLEESRSLQSQFEERKENSRSLQLQFSEKGESQLKAADIYLQRHPVRQLTNSGSHDISIATRNSNGNTSGQGFAPCFSLAIMNRRPQALAINKLNAKARTVITVNTTGLKPRCKKRDRMNKEITRLVVSNRFVHKAKKSEGFAWSETLAGANNIYLN